MSPWVWIEGGAVTANCLAAFATGSKGCERLSLWVMFSYGFSVFGIEHALPWPWQMAALAALDAFLLWRFRAISSSYRDVSSAKLPLTIIQILAISCHALTLITFNKFAHQYYTALDVLFFLSLFVTLRASLEHGIQLHRLLLSRRTAPAGRHNVRGG